jgi:hypothetical protein
VPALPPEVERVNAAERFVTRAYRRQDIQSESDAGLTAISIVHQVPLVLAVKTAGFRHAEHAAAAHNEMLAGASYPEIDPQAGDPGNTIENHGRRMHRKLDVQDRPS